MSQSEIVALYALKKTISAHVNQKIYWLVACSTSRSYSPGTWRTRDTSLHSEGILQERAPPNNSISLNTDMVELRYI